MRIEVGYGLEGTLTDVAASGQIIRDVMTPRFKAGNYDRGVEDGVNAIIAQLEGRGDRRPDRSRRCEQSERRGRLFNDGSISPGPSASCWARSSSASSGSSPWSA